MRGVSLPTKRTKEDLIKRLNQEKLKTRIEDIEEVKHTQKREKSMIVITEKFFNTKGSKHFISDDKLTHDMCKRASDVSTADCKSAHQGFNPYDDQGSRKRAKSNSYLDNIDDMTPQKLTFTKSPQVPFSPSYTERITPAKRFESTSKLKVGMSPASSNSKVSKTPKIIISKKRLSGSRVSSLFFKRKNLTVHISSSPTNTFSSVIRILHNLSFRIPRTV